MRQLIGRFDVPETALCSGVSAIRERQVSPLQARAQSQADIMSTNSSCSVQFGTGLVSSAPGCTQSVYLVVSDIEVARLELIARGANASEVFHRGGPTGRVSGPDPERKSYASFVSFTDPDSNSLLVQEVTARLPGRLNADVTQFTSATELAGALRRADSAHCEHERRTGRRDENWADWYAEYIVREQAGKELPK